MTIILIMSLLLVEILLLMCVRRLRTSRPGQCVLCGRRVPFNEDYCDNHESDL